MNRARSTTTGPSLPAPVAASILARVSLEQLAREFLKSIPAGSTDPWPPKLIAFAAVHDLDVVALKTLRALVLRERVFGALSRHGARQR